jgi:hypothetical protein
MMRKGTENEAYKFVNGELYITQPENDIEAKGNDSSVSQEGQENGQESGIDFKELDRQYAKRESEIEKALEGSKESLEESKKGSRDLMKGFGGIVEASFGERSKITAAQAEAEKEILKIEDAALGVPENREGEVLSKFEFEMDIAEIIKNLDNKTKELLRDFKEEREKFVEKQVQESIDKVGNRFNDVFKVAKNMRNAKEIILYKTEKLIREAAKEFIETGDEANFGILRAGVRVSTLKTGEEENETETNYITGYIINVGGHQMKIGEKYSPEGYPLMLNSDLDKIKKEKSYNRKAVKSKVEYK